MANSIFDQDPEFHIGIPLSRYTAAISRAVNTEPSLTGVWVIAELSDVRSSGGHCYLELIEKNEAGQTVAKLRANIWRSTFIELRRKFVTATQREITSGIKALIKGSATHHSLYGLSFNIVDIDPSYTMGDMERVRREIIMKLQKEGIVNLNKEKTLPPAPQRIAVISAEGAAGYGDFINQLTHNSDGFVFYPVLFPCTMQGDNVSPSIRHALEWIEASADMWDCIAIIRGGGATTDMNGFDDYALARAVATCGLPVIVGIGHDRDRNVLDEVAHTSVKTPTAVAAFLIDRLRLAYQNIISMADRLRGLSSDILRNEERHLASIHTLMPQLVMMKINESENKLRTISEKVPLLSQNRLGNEGMKIEALKNLIVNNEANIISKERLKINNSVNLISNYTLNIFQRTETKLSNIEDMIRVLDPQNTLKRGYSVTRLNGKALKDKLSVPPGSILTTTLFSGEIRSMAMTEEEE